MLLTAPSTCWVPCCPCKSLSSASNPCRALSTWLHLVSLACYNLLEHSNGFAVISVHSSIFYHLFYYLFLDIPQICPLRLSTPFHAPPYSRSWEQLLLEVPLPPLLAVSYLLPLIFSRSPSLLPCPPSYLLEEC